MFREHKKVEENISITRREMKDIKKTQMKLLEMKNPVSETKDTLKGTYYIRLDTAEEQVLKT